MSTLAAPAAATAHTNGTHTPQAHTDSVLRRSLVDSRLSLAFYAQAARTRLRVLAQEPPQRIVRAFYARTQDDERAFYARTQDDERAFYARTQDDGRAFHARTQDPDPQNTVENAALVHLHNLSGGVLGGDQLHLQVTVEADAEAQVTTTGATRIYRHRPGYVDARQEIHLRVDAGGLLEYLPDPLIPFRGARYQQRTRIELADDAGLFYWETVAPGRVAAGERFVYDRVGMDLAITTDEMPILLESFCLDPAQHPLTAPTRLGEYDYFTTFYICRVGLAAGVWSELETTLQQTAQAHTRPGRALWGVSRLAAHGLVVRGLAANHQAISATLPEFWRTAKRTLYNRVAIPPRKLY